MSRGVVCGRWRGVESPAKERGFWWAAAECAATHRVELEAVGVCDRFDGRPLVQFGLQRRDLRGTLVAVAQHRVENISEVLEALFDVSMGGRCRVREEVVHLVRWRDGHSAEIAFARAKDLEERVGPSGVGLDVTHGSFPSVVVRKYFEILPLKL